MLGWKMVMRMMRMRMIWMINLFLRFLPLALVILFTESSFSRKKKPPFTIVIIVLEPSYKKVSHSIAR